MIHVAVLGYGVVGSGVVELLDIHAAGISRKVNEQVQVKWILDLRSFPEDARVINDFNQILHDEDIAVIVEAMGGLEPAYTFLKQSLLAGKSCVTSNKEVVARHGTELLALAAEKNVNFMFEASVGGGIPIIRGLHHSVLPESIREIKAILNGTTNFILTQMAKQGTSFAEALADAQAKGYAEKDPTNDIEGLDTGRKLAILLSIITGKTVNWADISVEGIAGITTQDMAYAEALHTAIKLLAIGTVCETGVAAVVAPCLVHKQEILATVDDVLNAVLLQGDEIGDILFYGRGAGKLPTASAVVSDVVDCLKHRFTHVVSGWSAEKAVVLPKEDQLTQKLIRVGLGADPQNVRGTVAKVFPQSDFVDLFPDEVGVVTAGLEKDLAHGLAQLQDTRIEIKGVLRIER